MDVLFDDGATDAALPAINTLQQNTPVIVQ